MTFTGRGSIHDESMWEWDNEKWTGEVIALLCINTCKDKDHPEDLFVSNQNKWMPLSEGRITQYVNQKGHGLYLLPQNSLLNIVNIFTFKIFVFTKFETILLTSPAASGISESSQVLFLFGRAKIRTCCCKGDTCQFPNFRSKEYQFLQF